MVFSHFLLEALHAVKGYFTPAQLSARLFFDVEGEITEDKILIWFHERFHYLQSVFTSYGQLKWGAYRSVTSEIIDAWSNLLAKPDTEKMIPIGEYLKAPSKDGVSAAYKIWLQNTILKVYSMVERGVVSSELSSILQRLDTSEICPQIMLQGHPYYLRGIDIIESFAKFEEAMMAELISEKHIDDIIDPSCLNSEYFSALYYFIYEVGSERLFEFPIACELALAVPHIPKVDSIENYRTNSPNWRFVKIVSVLKETPSLPCVSFNDDKSFFNYTNEVLSLCKYDSWDNIWKSACEYAETTDLSMAKEMRSAISYKMENPWMLSYPMHDYGSFVSEEFNRFYPHYTIAEDGVMYNIDSISSTELVLENHLQALAMQISGQISPYCLDKGKIMCGYSYMGLKNCPHYMSGKCDGHIDYNNVMPSLKLDKDSNIIEGCTFELTLKMENIRVCDIKVGCMKEVSFQSILEAQEKLIQKK